MRIVIQCEGATIQVEGYANDEFDHALEAALASFKKMTGLIVHMYDDLDPPQAQRVQDMRGAEK